MNDDSLLNYYQQELAFIRQLGEEFAQAHPKVAGRLGLGAKTVEDPHVARLMEAFALSNARIRHKLEDDFPEIFTALLSILHPHSLAPIPGMSLVQFQADAAKLTAQKTIPANTLLTTEEIHGEPCHFTTRYPVDLLPIEMTQAQLNGQPLIAPIIPELTHTAATLQLSLRCTQSKGIFANLDINQLRFFINAQPQYAYALYELLFKHTIAIALADSPTDPSPIILDISCLQAVGFNQEEGMLPYHKRVLMGYQLLYDFFAFPEKFLFFNLVDLNEKITQKFTKANTPMEIFFYFDQLNPLLERNIDAQCFALHCTPIVNLFEKSAESFELTHTQTEYQLIADAKRPLQATEIYAVKRVTATTDNGEAMEYQPFYGLKHYMRTLYYHANRKPAWQGEHYVAKGTEIFLRFTDLELNPVNTERCVISTDILCTNRDLPGQLPFGGDEPRLKLAGNQLEPLKKIKCLVPMTPTRWPSLKQGACWRYVSHLSLNYLSLTNDSAGIEALRSLLTIYDFDQSKEHQNLLTGLVSIQAKPVTARNPDGRRGNVFWEGLEIILEVDESKFSGSSVYLFGCILERFFALYVNVNAFTQLVLTAKHKGEIHRWQPRAGERALL